MKKKAIIFIDYNDTFDDVCAGKGNVLFAGLTRFIKLYNENVKIAVITGAYRGYNDRFTDFTIRPDLAISLSYFPNIVREKFEYLIEDKCKYITPINAHTRQISYGETEELSQKGYTKKHGVEEFLRRIDPNNEVTTCIFAGDDDEDDYEMIKARIGDREKVFIYANRHHLKCEDYPMYKLSMTCSKTFNHGKEIFKTLKPANELIIKTSTKSYGVGKGFEATTCYLHEKDKEEENQ